MDLRKYIEGRGWGAVSLLARDSGLSRGTIEKAARGEAISVGAARALSAATGGQVTAAVLAGLAVADSDPAADGDAA